MHALVRELLAVMPPDGTPWPRAERERWTVALAAVLDVVYADDGRPLELPDLSELSEPPGPGSEPEEVVDLRSPARGRHARGGPAGHRG